MNSKTLVGGHCGILFSGNLFQILGQHEIGFRKKGQGIAFKIIRSLYVVQFPNSLVVLFYLKINVSFRNKIYVISLLIFNASHILMRFIEITVVPTS